MPLLFSYGTLQQEAVQLAAFGRRLRGEPDELVGFVATEREVTDPAFVAASGKRIHAIVRFDGRDESRVRGTALEVTDAELAAADRYEPEGWTRIAATLASGREAWVYGEAARRYTLDFSEIDRSSWPAVGAKGANLGELARIEGLRVPGGFCVTTDAFLDTSRRRAVEDEIAARVRQLGEDQAWAVRSSATAEDLPGASFAGQYDTWLNVTGVASVLEHVRRCQASLDAERAVAYRRQQGVDQRVLMAVVVQRMVPAEVSGVLFTADPVTSNRTVTSIDAAAGLGDALVSGRVTPETWRVRDGVILDRKGAPLLTDAQAAELERLGRTIEAHFGSPQDIEWCLAGGAFFIVQSRPITTLFPLPEAADRAPHVYLSVGHQQMMTDAMRPLGLSFWLMTTRAPMLTAGGRLFVDVAPLLASPGRDAVVATIGRGDPLMGDALRTLLARGFVPAAPPSDAPAAPGGVFAPPPAMANDPAIPARLIERSQASISAMRHGIATLSGPALFEFIRGDLEELKRHLFGRESSDAIRAAMGAAEWINERVERWLGEANAANALSQLAPGNITAEMGLALLDVADAVRGGADVGAALEEFLDRYGMRCPGEIDITRPRWAEAPAALVPVIMANVAMFAPGESRRRFERGREESLAKERDLLARLRQLPGGEEKAAELREQIGLLRTFTGYREYPKYAMMQRYFEYRKAILREAGRLAGEGVVREADDVYFLSFAELHDVVRTGRLDPGVVSERRDDFARHERLAPPRVMTSEGEIVTGTYGRRDLPAGALAGLAVSSGVVEGRARVVERMEDAALELGDILVTRFTDPGWTPLFVSISGLVTEVGGLMTHGAVVAREYGLPAVVGVEGAMERIADGQRVRVNGTEGYVEVL